MSWNIEVWKAFKEKLKTDYNVPELDLKNAEAILRNLNQDAINLFEKDRPVEATSIIKMRVESLQKIYEESRRQKIEIENKALEKRLDIENDSLSKLVELEHKKVLRDAEEKQFELNKKMTEEHDKTRVKSFEDIKLNIQRRFQQIQHEMKLNSVTRSE